MVDEKLVEEIARKMGNHRFFDMNDARELAREIIRIIMESMESKN